MNFASRKALIEIRQQLKLTSKAEQLELLAELRLIMKDAEPYRFQDFVNERIDDRKLLVFVQINKEVIPVRNFTRTLHDGEEVLMVRAA